MHITVVRACVIKRGVTILAADPRDPNLIWPEPSRMRIDLGKQAKDEPSLYFEKNNGLLHVAVDTVCRTFTEHSANSLVPVADFTHLTRFAAIEVKAGALYMQGRWTPTTAKTDLSSCIRASVVNRIIPALDHLQNVLSGHSTRSCPVAAHFPIP